MSEITNFKEYWVGNTLLRSYEKDGKTITTSWSGTGSPPPPPEGVRPSDATSPTEGKGTTRVTFKEDEDRAKTPRHLIKDSDWLKNTFMISEDSDPAQKFSRWLDRARFASSADKKITCPRIGMGLAVNPKPAITRNADILRVGRIHNRDESGLHIYNVPHYNYGTVFGSYGGGMGRGYSEVYDDNEQRIFLQFGEPQYMNILFFLSKSFDVNKSILYKRGFITRTLLSVVNAFSTIFAVTAMPWLHAAKILIDAILMPPRFVSLRDNMYTYWAIVDTLVNKMFVRRARIPMLQTANAIKGTDNKYKSGVSNDGSNSRTVSLDHIDQMSRLAPDLISAKTGRISMFTVALRSSAAYNAAMLDEVDVDQEIPEWTDLNKIQPNEPNMIKYFGEHDPDLKHNFIQTLFNMAADTIASNEEDTSDAAADMAQIAAAMDASGEYAGANFTETLLQDENPRMAAQQLHGINGTGGDLTISTATNNPYETGDGKSQENFAEDKNKQGSVTRFGKYLMESLKGGLAFAIFNVEATGATSESFSNATQSNPIETTFNSISSKVRSMGAVVGPLTDTPVIGDGIKFVADTASIVLSKVTLGLANPLLALFHGASLSIPKAWSDASASLPSGSYRIRCCPPYGNSYSHLFNMYIPLAMLLAGTLTRSTGLHSYTSPFLCRLFDVGRVNIDLGIISSLTVTRGVSNLSHNRAGHANAIDIEFTVTDLNDIVSLELGNNGVLMNAAKALIPDTSESSMDTYINTITGMDVYTQFYKVPKLRLKLIDKHMALQTLFDPAAMGAAMGNIISSITPNFINNGARELWGESAPSRITSQQY